MASVAFAVMLVWKEADIRRLAYAVAIMFFILEKFPERDWAYTLAVLHGWEALGASMHNVGDNISSNSLGGQTMMP